MDEKACRRQTLELIGPIYELPKNEVFWIQPLDSGIYLHHLKLSISTMTSAWQVGQPNKSAWLRLFLPKEHCTECIFPYLLLPNLSDTQNHTNITLSSRQLTNGPNFLVLHHKRMKRPAGDKHSNLFAHLWVMKKIKCSEYSSCILAIAFTT